MPKIWNPNLKEETNWNMMKIPMATIISSLTLIFHIPEIVYLSMKTREIQNILQ